MYIDALLRDVRAFRRAFETCHSDLDAMIFGSFPRGCCGAASELHAVFLERRGHGAFTYVSARGFNDDNRLFSHAWLERDGLILDVTQDQFDERSEPVFVATDRSWHDRRFPEQ